MKITVIADQSGKIVAAKYSLEPVGFRRATQTMMVAAAGQTVHEVDVPAELLQHLGTDAFAKELLSHRIEVKGGRTRLVRAT